MDSRRGWGGVWEFHGNNFLCVDSFTPEILIKTNETKLINYKPFILDQ